MIEKNLRAGINGSVSIFIVSSPILLQYSNSSTCNYLHRLNLATNYSKPSYVMFVLKSHSVPPNLKILNLFSWMKMYLKLSSEIFGFLNKVKQFTFGNSCKTSSTTLSSIFFISDMSITSKLGHELAIAFRSKSPIGYGTLVYYSDLSLSSFIPTKALPNSTAKFLSTKCSKVV